MTLKHGAKVRDYMTRKLVTLSPEMEVMEAVQVLVQKQISGAPVIDRFGTLVGMLSEKDCMRIVLNAGYFGEWGGRAFAEPVAGNEPDQFAAFGKDEDTVAAVPLHAG